MRTLVSGIAAAAILAVIAGAVFWTVREPVHTVYSSSSTRVGEPGSNLVGKAWTGNPSVTEGSQATVDSRAGSAE